MQTLGIYIQFPFCASKCSFCNFSSRVEPRAAYGPYLEALESEAGFTREMRLPQHVRPDFPLLPVDTIYCGGGTPSLAGPDGLARISDTLRRSFRVSEEPEWTMEITPGSADRDLLKQMRESGVNRLSVGAQSFNDHELRSAGRLHDADEIREQLATARQAGFRNLSVDLIAGLPYQTEMSWQLSLADVARLRPEHVSVYLFEEDNRSRLGRERAMKGGRYGADSVPGDDFMAWAYEQARESLAEQGYLQYEISNFALAGCESRHNQKYWQLKPYLGLGAGAHSFDGVSRWSNAEEPKSYQARLTRSELPVEEIRTVSPSEQVEEFFFLGLRQCIGVNLQLARSRWGAPPLNWWEERARRLVEEGALEEEYQWLRLKRDKYLLSNEIFQQFLM